jgi:hypothetical protein
VNSESSFCGHCGTPIPAFNPEPKGLPAKRPQFRVGWTYIAFIAFVAWIYISPYLALSNLKQASVGGNVEALNEAVDFPAFRSSLKEELNGQMSGADVALAAIGITGMVVSGFVDQMVTPQGIANMLKGKEIAEIGLFDIWSGKDGNENEVRVYSGYESFDRFRVRIFPPKSKVPISLIWFRSGLVTWRLSAVQLPNLRELGSPTNEASAPQAPPVKTLDAPQSLAPPAAPQISAALPRFRGWTARCTIGMILQRSPTLRGCLEALITPFAQPRRTQQQRQLSAPWPPPVGGLRGQS